MTAVEVVAMAIAGVLIMHLAWQAPEAINRIRHRRTRRGR